MSSEPPSILRLSTSAAAVRVVHAFASSEVGVAPARAGSKQASPSGHAAYHGAERASSSAASPCANVEPGQPTNQAASRQTAKSTSAARVYDPFAALELHCESYDTFTPAAFPVRAKRAPHDVRPDVSSRSSSRSGTFLPTATKTSRAVCSAGTAAIPSTRWVSVGGGPEPTVLAHICMSRSILACMQP